VCPSRKFFLPDRGLLPDECKRVDPSGQLHEPPELEAGFLPREVSTISVLRHDRSNIVFRDVGNPQSPNVAPRSPRVCIAFSATLIKFCII
jgi:hypothetical protein